MRELNSIELTKKLQEIAAGCKYDMSICNGIITAIINHYMAYSNYYTDDAIKTLNTFINKAILVF